MDGGQWWAEVAERHNDSNRRYWTVIAWERAHDSELSLGPHLVAWINGRDPVRSDQFGTRVPYYVLHGFVDAVPDHAGVTSWS